jgi:tol-pal system beta propeller repeat protein TolB
MLKSSIKMFMLFAISNLLMGQSPGFFPADAVPEVELEARTMSYFRPALVFPAENTGNNLLADFVRRLHRDIELSGFVDMYDVLPQKPLADEEELLLDSWENQIAAWLIFDYSNVSELIEFDPELKPDSQKVRLGLRAALETTKFSYAGWDLQLDPENVFLQADIFAVELLELLSGFKAPFNSRILYCEPQSSGNRLMLSDFFAERIQPLSRGGKPKFSPSWSPNGDYYAYVSLDEETGADIYIASINGGKPLVLIAGPQSEAAPSWSPDGNWICCAATVDGNTDIYLLPAPGSANFSNKPVDFRRLTFSPGIDTNPSWSPDSRKLVFSSDRSGSLQLYIIDIDGLSEERISFQGKMNDCPAWSPTGDWIAFVSREKDGFQLFQMRPDGSDLVRLTRESGNHFDPCWSPDGQQLAFGWQDKIWLIFADGTGLRQLSPGKGYNPAWIGLKEN